MKKIGITREYAFTMIILGSLMACAIAAGLLYGILLMIDSGAAGRIALDLGSLFGIVAFVVIPIYFLRKDTDDAQK